MEYNSREYKKLKQSFRNMLNNRRGYLPSPIACRIKGLYDDEPGKQTISIVGFLDSIAGFLGSIIISLYINEPEDRRFSSNILNISTLEFLRRPPSLGKWLEILRQGYAYFSKQEDFIIPELIGYYRGIPDPFDKNKNIKLDDLLSDLNSFRLGVGHPDNLARYLKRYNIEFKTEDDLISGYEKAMPMVLEQLFRLFEGFDFLKDYWLFYLKQHYGDNIYNIYLYNSEEPIESEIYIPPNIRNIEDFSDNLFRYRLFFARIAQSSKEDGLMEANKITELNPVLINWDKDKIYYPYRFTKWKDKKRNHILMNDIITWGKEETIPEENTKRFLLDVHNRLKIILKSQDEYETPEEKPFLDISHSKHRHDIVRKEIYPHLNIADEILPHIASNKKGDISGTEHTLEVTVKAEDTGRLELFNILSKLWHKDDKKHAVLLGDGGMGKTTSLLKLWEKILEQRHEVPVPIFLRLERYNNMKMDRRRDFIYYAISEEYLNRVPSSDDIINMENWLRQPKQIDGREIPGVILLLDGYNEIASDTTDLLKCLNELRKFKGVQIILSSRYDMLSSLQWNDFTRFDLEDLEDDQIKEFMKARDIEYNNETIKNIPLLRNPMMLTIYCGIEREMHSLKGKEDYDFIHIPQVKAELLHNFIESMLARLDRINEIPDDKIFARLLIRFLLPKIGYEMEKNGQYEISYEMLRDNIKEEIELYISDEFLDTHSNIEKDMSESLLIKFQPGTASQNRILINSIIHKITKEYALLRSFDTGNYSFLHQDFRDFFASCHIISSLKQCIKKNDKELPILRERLFPYHLRIMIGGYTGEHKRKPVIDSSGYHQGKKEQTLLDRALNTLRGIEMDKKDYRILNIIEILKETRCDLSDTDLSSLDLRRIVLNNVRLGHGKIKDKVIGADLSKSIIKGENLLSQGHSDWVNSVQYNPAGNRLISASFDRTIREWDIETGQCINIYTAHNNRVNSAHYSSDGEKIVSASEDKTIREWKVETGECIKIYEGHSGGVKSAQYSPEGNRIVSASDDNTIREWEVKTGKCIRIYVGHSKGLSSAQYSPDGEKIVSAGLDGTIRKWDVKTGRCIDIYDCLPNAVFSACYSPDGKKILSTHNDDIIKEWNSETCACITNYKGHKDGVNSAQYSPDGMRIASASRDKTIREWDVKTGECINIYEGLSYGLNSLQYSPNGKRIVSADTTGSIMAWDIQTRKCIMRYESNSWNVKSAQYSLDGEKILTANNDRTIREWETKGGRCIRTYKGHDGTVNSAQYSPNLKRIVSASDDLTIKEWDIETGKCIKTYKGHTWPVDSAYFSLDGRRILSASKWDRTVREWNTETGKCIKTYKSLFYNMPSGRCSTDGNKSIRFYDNTIHEYNKETGNLIRVYMGHNKKVNSAEYSPDCRRVVSASEDETIREWDVRTGECISIFTGHSDCVSSAQYSPDGRKIVSTSWDNTIREWDIQTGKCIRIYMGYSHNLSDNLGHAAAQYSFDGKKILSVNNWNKIVSEWDVKTGECIKKYENHSFRLESAQYSPDGKRAVSIGDYTLIIEWDIETGKYIKLYNGHSDSISSIQYSRDGRKILSASLDKTIREWDTQTGDCINIYRSGHCIKSAKYSPDGNKFLSVDTFQKQITEWDVKTGECIKIYEGHCGDLISAEYSFEGCKILSSSEDGTIREWDVKTGKCISTYNNIFGLLIQGIDLRDLSPKSEISDEQRDVFWRYGAKIQKHLK